MSLVIEEKEIEELPVTVDPEILSGAPVFKGTRGSGRSLNQQSRSRANSRRVPGELPDSHTRAGNTGVGLLTSNAPTLVRRPMKILLDECTPHVLKQRLPGFQMTTVQELGWAGITNGELLALAKEQFGRFYYH